MGFNSEIKRVTSDAVLGENWFAITSNEPSKQNLKNGNPSSSLEALPEEILVFLSHFFDPISFARAGATCKILHRITKDPHLAYKNLQIQKICNQLNLAKGRYVVRSPLGEETNMLAYLKAEHRSLDQGVLIIDRANVLLSRQITRGKQGDFQASFRPVPRHLTIPNNVLQIINNSTASAYTIKIDTDSPLISLRFHTDSKIYLLDRTGNGFVVDFTIPVVRESKWYTGLFTRVVQQVQQYKHIVA